MTTLSNVPIDLGERSYTIVIGEGILSCAYDHMPFDVSGKTFFIVTDRNVQGYAGRLRDTFMEQGARSATLKVFPAGESTKSYESLKETHNWLLSNNVHRDSIVVAVGGGVIGDLTGFAASTILRGVSFVQVPTSLLAQVDSSVGGKTGINTVYGKNLVGSFYQPTSVVIDTKSLQTLPTRELYAGYAEVVKYGLLGDKVFFEWLENGHGKGLLYLNSADTTQAIETCCKAKARVVEADEREEGTRALLNLGHTFGHAFEALAGYDGSLLHGEAVALGIVLAFDLSVRMGLCPVEDYERVVAHFREVGLPVRLKDTQAKAAVLSGRQAVLDIIRRDKKALDGRLVFVLVRGIGEAFVHKDVSSDGVLEALDAFLEEE